MKFLIFLFSFLTFTSCFRDNRSSYEMKVSADRLEKDKVFKFEAESPFTTSEQRNFTGLKYFPPDESYRVEAEIERVDSPEIIQLATTIGKTEYYREYAILHFPLEDRMIDLMSYQSIEVLTDDENSRELFVPFYDETNGDETYGGGRYIDLLIPEGEYLTIDFNYAYNPYCIYNDRYSCPVPPSSNRIPLSINAGEKNYP